LEEGALAAAKKNAARQGQTILFVDERGLSERPHRGRTWAPRGETPVLQYHFHWHTLATIAGVSWWKFYVQLHPGTIRAPQVVAFLTHLLRHVRGKLLIVWDKLPAHRSHLVRDFVAAHLNRWLSGDSYTDVKDDGWDAIVAIDLATGVVKWCGFR
jgi:hypothetical protein